MEKVDKVLTMPLIPLRGLSVFPYMVLHFDVGREKSVKALEEAMINDQKIFLTTQIDIDVDLPTSEDFYKIGTICKIKQMLKLPGDTIRVLVEGLSRGRVEEIIEEEPFFRAHITKFDEDQSKDREIEALMRSCLAAFEKYINVSNRTSPDSLLSVSSIEEPGRFADSLASHMALKIEQKQDIIEAIEPKRRLEVIYSILLSEIEIMEVEKEINERLESKSIKCKKSTTSENK